MQKQTAGHRNTVFSLARGVQPSYLRRRPALCRNLHSGQYRSTTFSINGSLLYASIQEARAGLAPQRQEACWDIWQRSGNHLLALKTRGTCIERLACFDVTERVVSARGEGGPNQRVTELSGNNVVEFDCDDRGNVIVGIGIVGIRGTECCSGQKKHEAKHNAAEITMTEQRNAPLPLPPGVSERQIQSNRI